MECPKCGSRFLHPSRPRTVQEYTDKLRFIMPLRCIDCKTRFIAKTLDWADLRYAACPQCYRTDLSKWTGKSYKPDFFDRFKIWLGARRWRCEYCRLNFASFRGRKEVFSFRRWAKFAAPAEPKSGRLTPDEQISIAKSRMQLSREALEQVEHEEREERELATAKALKARALTLEAEKRESRQQEAERWEADKHEAEKRPPAQPAPEPPAPLVEAARLEAPPPPEPQLFEEQVIVNQPPPEALPAPPPVPPEAPRPKPARVPIWLKNTSPGG